MIRRIVWACLLTSASWAQERSPEDFAEIASAPRSGALPMQAIRYSSASFVCRRAAVRIRWQ
jgi:hypothetical protein